MPWNHPVFCYVTLLPNCWLFCFVFLIEVPEDSEDCQHRRKAGHFIWLLSKNVGQVSDMAKIVLYHNLRDYCCPLLVTTPKHWRIWSSLQQMGEHSQARTMHSRGHKPLSEPTRRIQQSCRWRITSGITCLATLQKKSNSCQHNLKILPAHSFSDHSRGVLEFLFPFCWDPPDKMPRPQSPTFFYSLPFLQLWLTKQN